jgi:hypothetical protein
MVPWVLKIKPRTATVKCAKWRGNNRARLGLGGACEKLEAARSIFLSSSEIVYTSNSVQASRLLRGQNAENMGLSHRFHL